MLLPIYGTLTVGVIMAFPGISYGPSAAPYIRIAELRAQREAATEQRYASRARRVASESARARQLIDKVSLSATERMEQRFSENGSLKDELQQSLSR